MPARIGPVQPGDPARIGPYRIIGRLGAGGMGTVLAALDPAGLRVAVKLIHPAQAEDPEFRARFRREVALSRRVSGPCLVPLLAADPEAERPWLATAYAPGPTLDEHVAAHGPLTGGSLYAFAVGTVTALAAVHQAGVIHRDLKPQNVVLTPAGPRVLDFGIAHALDGTSVTRTGMVTGTPGWISPEVYRTGEAGPEGDVFAWGALVAYAATGRMPFGTGAPDVVAYRVMSEPADTDGVPAALAEILERALAKEPADRPTAAEAAERCVALLAARTTQVVGAGAEPTLVDGVVSAAWDVPPHDDPGWPARPRPSRKRTSAVALVATVAAGALIGGAVLLVNQDDSADAPSATPSGSRQAPASSSASVTTSPREESPAGPGSPTGSQPVPGRGGTPDAPEGGVTVVVSGDGTSWVSARDHRGELLFDGLLRQGETRTFTDEEKVELVLGDASRIRLVVNGEKVREEFPSGQVQRLSYTADDPGKG
ncbi:RodZ domain-containing protein [Streptomyces sp. NPDC018031]|uniref:RodZ domain-containing protein n=1 Tax=Streptomyces sp. NPDC018031 TaxID=3365033 RepID=UPI0037B7585F